MNDLKYFIYLYDLIKAISKYLNLNNIQKKKTKKNKGPKIKKTQKKKKIKLNN